MRVGGDVEHLRGRRPRAVARGDVADGVAAGLARRDARRREEAKQVRGLLELQVVDLHVFPRRQVQEAAPEPIGGVGEADQLIRRENPARDLDALHLHAVLPLGVRAELQADLLHLHLPHLAAAVLLDLFFVEIELRRDGLRERCGGRGDEAIDRGHVPVL